MLAALLWIIGTLILAAGFLLLFLWRVPYFLIKTVVRLFGRKLEIDPWNRLGMSSMASAGSDRVVMSSPDMLYRFGAFDVSKHPVVVHCVVPDQDTYWCISLYARNTDNFYVRNDRNARDREFDLVIVGPKNQFQKSGDEEVVVAPSARGVVLIRAVMKDPEDPHEVARLQEFLNRTTIVPYSQGVPISVG
ncbi:MAG TPA: DUF1254 domain-containing protein [Bryobacteraceae bacterium]|jgi:uncharacterized membrane protein